MSTSNIRQPLGTPLLRENLHAILIGVSYYDDGSLEQLDGALYDALALYSFLTRSWGVPSDQIHKMTGGVGYLKARTEIEQVCAGLTEQDHLLFFYSGHGILGNGKGKTYLAFTDTRKKEERGKTVDTNVMSVNYLNQLFRKCRAGIKIRIFDCCHNGEPFGNPPNYCDRNEQAEEATPDFPKTPPSPLYQQLMTAHRGWVTFCSCGMNEVSEENYYQGSKVLHGLFSYYLLTTLQRFHDTPGEGPYYIEDLKNEVNRAMQEDLRSNPRPMKVGDKWENPHQQHMQYQCSLAGNLLL